VSAPRQTAGKRNLQQQKREKAQAKVARKAARRAVDPDATPVQVEASESELIEQLANLHRAAEAGDVSAQDFEERREHLRKQFEQIEMSKTTNTDRGARTAETAGPLPTGGGA
jgi:hypothetical protein